jgi:hypothetical protein
MSLNENFSSTAPVGLPVLWCPPHAPDDVVPAMIADSLHGGLVNLNTFPTAKRNKTGILMGVPHVSDPSLFDDHGKPTERAKRTGWWMFPKWYEDLVEVRSVSAPERKSNKSKDSN